METFRTYYEKSWLPGIEKKYSEHSFKLRIYPPVLLTLWARWQRWHPACKKFCSNKQDLAGLGVAVEKMGWGNTNWSCERLCKVVTQRPSWTGLGVSSETTTMEWGQCDQLSAWSCSSGRGVVQRQDVTASGFCL